MSDMLVKLYELPGIEAELQEQQENGVDIRRVIAPEKHIVVDWVRETFGPHWGSEVDVAINNRPPSCFVAVEAEQPVGFACYDATFRGSFGPTGVNESLRGRGIGRVLMLACLHDMLAQGYGYAIIGSAGPVDYYARTVGATVIPDSSPGMYRGMLRR
jgi:predicted GNAT family acetyltransferase